MMELTKEQIQFIDNRLKNEGIKYWDIRIEMLDHIVSDVEKNAKTTNFKSELNSALKRIGWSGSLRDINIKAWQNVNRKYRKVYFDGFVDFFKKPKNVLVFFILFLCYFFSSKTLEHQLFLKFSNVLFVLPMLGVIITFYKSWRKKLGKSVHKEYGVSYLFFSFIMLNVVINFVRMDGGFPVEYHKIILLVLIPVHYVLTYSGFIVYKKAIARVEKMRNQLL